MIEAELGVVETVVTTVVVTGVTVTGWGEEAIVEDASMEDGKVEPDTDVYEVNSEGGTSVQVWVVPATTHVMLVF
jgi:hypothetical protein